MGIFGPNDINKMKENENIKGLIKALDATNEGYVNQATAEARRKAAAEALVKIGQPAVESLINALRDDSSIIQRKAADLLEIIGWQPGRGDDWAWFLVAKRDWEKAASMGTLAIEPIIKVLRDKPKAATKALVKIGVPAVDPLLSSLKEDFSWAAAEALEKIGWEPTGGESEAYYWIAKGNLGKAAALGPPAIEPLISAFLKDEFDLLQEDAVEVLVKISDSRVLEKLIFILEYDGNHGNRAVAAEILGRVGDPRAVKPLISALDKCGLFDRLDPGARTVLRRHAAKALVMIYQEKKLNEDLRKLILAERKKITKKHIDSAIWDNTCFESHEDQGIGIDFPL
jgi:HEAT repeat protein